MIFMATFFAAQIALQNFATFSAEKQRPYDDDGNINRCM